ncbi:hypothetical protein DY000_02052572 [Brassica cretica]|uniref:Uncharacterized protein n=1 Tax=Brassica cretica TaxID=69181 RepID=A0ABQ7AFY4_BRACR|nr:hypothetical protein DY000_02052572 [Brassica cretica]
MEDSPYQQFVFLGAGGGSWNRYWGTRYWGPRNFLEQGSGDQGPAWGSEENDT